jgi:peptidoglycan/LPS O-acetylase OafA/YrhL
VTTPLDLKPLTALRFAAALWVVSFHYWPELAGAVTPALVQKGYLGVELFFVLSGFILSHVYLQNFGEARFRYGDFIWARIARVYPLHLATLLGVAALAIAATAAGMVMDHPVADWGAFPANLAMLHAWGLAPSASFNHPSWSISAEWFAYLTFPAFAWAAWKLKDRPNMAVIGTLILMFGIYAVFEAKAGFPLTQATFQWGALRIVPCFAYGCAVYLLWRSGAIESRFQAKFWACAFGVMTFGLGYITAPDATCVTVFGGLILALAGLTSTGSRVLSNRVGVYLGEVSYAVYMVCFPWKLVFTNTAEKFFGYENGLPLWLWAVMFAGVLPVAMIAHHLVERPARAAMRRWSDRGYPMPLVTKAA